MAKKAPSTNTLVTDKKLFTELLQLIGQSRQQVVMYAGSHCQHTKHTDRQWHPQHVQRSLI